MAKKKSKSKGSSNSAASLTKELQQIASNAQIEVQRLANEATEKSFKYNTEEANTARTWQTQMSNTAHQREVADLRKAGLNPVLAANQGAQSYTTSSASAQANDPSGSVGNLAASMMSSRTGAYQADVSAAATKAAAAQAASATRYAARANLAAARAAAGAQIYSADRSYDAQKYVTDHSKNGSVAGILSNYRKETKNDNTGIGTSMSKLWGKVEKNPSYFFKTDKVGKFIDLNASGRNIVQKSLRRMGISENLKNQQIMYKAIFKNNAKAKNIVAGWMIAFNNRSLHARTVWSQRSGSGIW